ncbi:unnamed protein product [Brassicogethes aeneus]|uniref:MIF4G domain-containing protein n=1 Tax=Brassicogethes aeneus TaxID=1431903 RepID=A0A9P0B9Y0_BRAAE|nr:unnamed protein product [Brassicogethes aeneus]
MHPQAFAPTNYASPPATSYSPMVRPQQQQSSAPSNSAQPAIPNLRIRQRRFKRGHRPNAISIIDPDTGKDRLNEVFGENSDSDLNSKPDENKKTAELYKKVQDVLDKLTPKNFDTLIAQTRKLEFSNAERLQGVIDLVFEKAVDEPNFSVVYPRMCRELALIQVPTANSTPEAPDFVNFKKLLITKCQIEFEKQSVDESTREVKMKEIEATADADKKKDLQFELDKYDRKVTMRSVGNVRFIGELFKQQMLTVNIMLRCLNKLLDKKDEESLECLCKLLTTIGKELETKNVPLEPIFKVMRDIVERRTIIVSSRVERLVQDVIDLRAAKWVPQRQEVNPKTGRHFNANLSNTRKKGANIKNVVAPPMAAQSSNIYTAMEKAWPAATAPHSDEQAEKGKSKMY